MLQESGERPSVRNVAARAGVGASTLRHYFPTQQALLDSALTRIYEVAMPDERIHDATVPARERLVEVLWQTLEPFAPTAKARETWSHVFDAFISPTSTDEARASYVVLNQRAALRFEAWLVILEQEGSLPAGDNRRRAAFLMTVTNGLALERALPATQTQLEDERTSLALAVEAVFVGVER